MLHAFQLFTSNCVAKIFLPLLKATWNELILGSCWILYIQNMYDGPNNGMTTQTPGLWKSLALPGAVRTSVRWRVMPLLQSREIHTGIGEMGLPESVHKVIIQILALKVCITSQKLTAKRFHMGFLWQLLCLWFHFVKPCHFEQYLIFQFSKFYSTVDI